MTFTPMNLSQSGAKVVQQALLSLHYFGFRYQSLGGRSCLPTEVKQQQLLPTKLLNDGSRTTAAIAHEAAYRRK
jgi:hypothetical protein